MTLATEFAETTRRSLTSPDMQKRVIHLYRRFIRGAPTFVELYELNMPISSVKTKIRQNFERNRYISDLSIINIIYMKGQMEYQESINFWKQQCQVMKYFKDEEVYETADNSFVSKFLRGN
ncbi:NADH dehydrogenase [ubiquinone] 1 alpha subcomplex subunit 6 ASCRUDRAFT_53355 [Ascoidea rubescens DSM 1968]|uniref:Complex 1 LYR protein domain-containing protein n=1 Tax=Ascoidea rubescens DSM 1968 TaxID=1344418 RepID=A0A1D2VQZ9_9ASCO|nr:hypothetical protein ASCRUDRAFT_53355 [Ascoidea rubescens DSM 1968]ODV64019.1 hypothetical protein ASCRUDRAFT_53355 [Ascoidea rubescens DSM 1968]